jgi:HCOMODA/2-hydroxy-3-carboxy-muconic semialdehyde decarboxylase
MAEEQDLLFQNHPSRRMFLSSVALTGALSLMDPAAGAQEHVHERRGQSGSVGFFEPPPDSEEQRIEDLVTCNRICSDLELVDGMGHPSVRSLENPSHYYMAQSVAPGLVTRDDIIEFDQDSKAIDLRGREDHGERFIHGEIYRARPDVQAIVHCHTSMVIPFGLTGTPLPPVIHMAGFLPDNVPIFDVRDVKDNGGDDGMLVRNPQLGSALAKTLGDSSVVLMRGHGMTVVGVNVPQATARTWYTYVNAQITLETLKLGRPITINKAEGGMFAGPNAGDRNWLLWKAQANLKSAALIAALKDRGGR